MVWSVADVVECLPSKHKAGVQIPVLLKKKKKETKEKERVIDELLTHRRQRQED
jgi:hypothetical protein